MSTVFATPFEPRTVRVRRQTMPEEGKQKRVWRARRKISDAVELAPEKLPVRFSRRSGWPEKDDWESCFHQAAGRHANAESPEHDGGPWSGDEGCIEGRCDWGPNRCVCRQSCIKDQRLGNQLEGCLCLYELELRFLSQLTHDCL